MNKEIEKTTRRIKVLSLIMGISFTMVIPITGILLGLLVERVQTSRKVWISFIVIDFLFVAIFTLLYFWFRKKGSRQLNEIDPYIINYATGEYNWNSFEDIKALTLLQKYDFGYYGRCIKERDFRIYVFDFPMYDPKYYDFLHKESLEIIDIPNATMHQYARINILVIENWSKEAESVSRVNAGYKLHYNGIVEVFVDLQNKRVVIPKCIFDHYGYVSKYLCCVRMALSFLFDSFSTA